MEVVGDFSLINPYGVRVKGFPCGMSGLRVYQVSGLGLRVWLADGHVMLLIPLYLTWGVLNWRPITGLTGHWLSLISKPSIQPISR